MLQEFKKFALKGNMIDLAVGIIIGGAFNGIVSSLINDIIMPLLSIFTKQISFIDWFVAMDGKEYESLEAAQAEAVATLNYGVFISNVLNFIIMAFVIFLIVKFLNKLKKTDQTAPSTKKCPQCYSDINVNATKCPCCTADIQSNS